MVIGAVIFSAAAVIEIVLMLFSIRTKTYQNKVRSFIRIAVFAVFALLTLLPVIDWSFRYYALAGLLFLTAVFGLVRLMRHKEEKKAYKTARVVLRAVGMTALIFAVTLPAMIFPQHKPVKITGEYQVATAAYTYTDESRMEIYTDKNEHRKLNVEFWYPLDVETAGLNSCPLIVFSHGSLGIKTSNVSLYNDLASHGYVVCAIDHTYQCFFTTDDNGHTALINMDYMRELQAENAKLDKAQSAAYYRKWMDIRTGDINFVIDRILTELKNNDAEKVYTLIDSTRLGVIGHSLGGSAALGIGRLRRDIGAVIALEAPFMCDIEGVADGEFIWNDSPYPVPVLNIYSDSKWNSLDEWPQYAENSALLSGTATAFNVHISGAGHLTLTDLSLTSPFLTHILNGYQSTIKAEDCLQEISKICLKFFDCYLKGEGTFFS